MRLQIRHQTSYRYDAPVHYALQQLRLTPKSRGYQSVLGWQTTVQGGRKEAEFNDEHDNHVELVSFEPGMCEITISSEGEVETRDTGGVYGEHYGHVPLWLFKRPTRQTAPGPLVRKLARAIPGAGEGGAGEGDVARMHALSAAVLRAVSYETGKTDSAWAAEQVLAAGHGVCQDHAHVMIAAARLMGFPARYVSGYLMLTEQIDEEATHAWVEVHVDGLGWVGFDVSNGISPDERYVRVATGLDYRGAAPISGMRFGDSGESLTVSLQVQQQ